MYSENDRLDLDIFYKNIIKVRGFRKFDNYNIFNNRSVKQIRSFENKIYYQKINNRIGQYKNYKNITNGKDFYSDF
jgi:ABC-type molybdate transport system substrate-binding protein